MYLRCPICGDRFDAREVDVDELGCYNCREKAHELAYRKPARARQVC
jgi:hypothetical protein